jgi:hypothetical protein
VEREPLPAGDSLVSGAMLILLVEDDKKEDSPARGVLVLMTDGEDSTSGLSLAETIQLVRSHSVTIYAIAFPGEYAAGSNRDPFCASIPA